MVPRPHGFYKINPHRMASVSEWNKPHPFISVFCLMLLLVCGGLVVAPAAVAEDPLYLRGYIDEMLDSRFLSSGPEFDPK